VADIDAASTREGDVFATPRGIQSLHEVGVVFDVAIVEAFCASEGHCKSVRDQGKVTTKQIEFGGFRWQSIHVVICSDFEEVDLLSKREEFCEHRFAEA
jgi:hypothetical protein